MPPSLANAPCDQSPAAPLRGVHAEVDGRGLDREFNTPDAPRDACEAYLASQRAEGWVLVPDRCDDGGFSGGSLDRPALKRLLAYIEQGRVDVIVNLNLAVTERDLFQ